ncbi:MULTISPECIES: hypothetical protein [unclassified Streptomyces]|uniref:hypothetical protein n=1 Tax=unclassified Streptomyces TaxID=2593676 RepID=UPI0033B4B9DE
MLNEFATWRHGIDLVAVDRVLNGSLSPTELRSEELKFAARRATGSARQVAAILGVTEKTVASWREAKK